MKMRGKIAFSTIPLFLVTIVVIVIAVYWKITVTENRNMEEYEIQETAKIESKIENYVEIAYQTIVSQFKNLHNPTYFEEKYGDRLKSLMDVAFKTIDTKYEMYRNGLLSLREAKSEAMEAIRIMRFGDVPEGNESWKDYFWINSTDAIPIMIMHPNRALEGHVMSDPKFETVQGYYTHKNLFLEFVEVCKDDGEGFVWYEWPRPSDPTGPVYPKISYVRKYDEWDWIVGTGVYIDDAIEAARLEVIDTIKGMRYDSGLGYFWINDIAEPYPRFVMHPISPALDNTSFEGELWENRAIYDTADSGNTNLGLAIRAVAVSEEGEGIVRYMWKKPNEEEDSPKTSFVKLFNPETVTCDIINCEGSDCPDPDCEKILDNRYFDNWEMVVGTGIYTDALHDEIAAQKADTKSQIRSLTLIVVGISLGVIILMMLLIIIFSKKLTTPIKIMEGAVDIVSQGDLTVDISVSSKDEIGTMSTHFNTVIGSFKDLIHKIKENSIIINKAIQELNVSSKEISTTSNQQAAAVKEIVSTMEDSDHLTKGIATKINEVASISDQTKSNSEKGAGYVSENMSKMDEIRKTNNQTISGIKELGELIESIWDVVNIINGIADQTKIIAFNAELEASAAGEVGKNFQIVATEIRRLADNTVSSTSEIKRKINEIQKASDNLILASEEGTTKIKEGWELSGSLKKVFEEILNSSEISAASASQIVSSVDQQVQAFEQILQTLKQIAEGIDNFVVSTKSTSQASESLKDMGDKLKDIVDHYIV